MRLNRKIEVPVVPLETRDGGRPQAASPRFGAPACARRRALSRRHPRARGHAACRRRHGRQGGGRAALARPRRRARRARRRRGADRRPTFPARTTSRPRSTTSRCSPTRKSCSTASRCSRSSRDNARRGAARGAARQDRHRGGQARDHGRRRADHRRARAAGLRIRPRRRRGRARRGAASARGQVPHRRAGAFLSRRPGLARHSRRGRRDAPCMSRRRTRPRSQHIVARMLGVPDAFVTVETRRMGGGFGGKESQACQWAAIAALGARVTGAPCKIRLDRDDDFVLTGKRHDFRADWRVGYDETGRIEVYEVDAQRALRLLGRSLARRRRPRDVSRLQRLLARGRAHRLAAAEDQHRLQHRLPRLRRPAGHDRDRARDRRDRARARPRSARRAQGQFLSPRRRPDALQPDGRGSRDAAGDDRRAGDLERLSRAPRRRSRRSTRRARS